MFSRHAIRPIVIVAAIAGSLLSVPLTLGFDLQKDNPRNEAMSETMRRDAKITAAIRAELTKESSLSPEAKNESVPA